MRFARPLVRGTLVRRYKRFLADVMLDDGRAVTAHCANPGAMLGLCDPGARRSGSSRTTTRGAACATPGGWSSSAAGTWSGSTPACRTGSSPRRWPRARVPALAGYADGAARGALRHAEPDRLPADRAGAARRLRRGEERPPARATAGLAEFPDSVTARGTRHLAELAAMAAAGRRAVMLYLVQRTDCARFRLAADLDPAYAAAFAAARAAGVEAIAHALPDRPRGGPARGGAAGRGVRIQALHACNSTYLIDIVRSERNNTPERRRDQRPPNGGNQGGRERACLDPDAAHKGGAGEEPRRSTMSIPQSGGGPIERFEQLAEYLAAGCKPEADWRIGTEHEKFGYLLADAPPLPYDGRLLGPRHARRPARPLRLGAGRGGGQAHRAAPRAAPTSASSPAASSSSPARRSGPSTRPATR